MIGMGFWSLGMTSYHVECFPIPENRNIGLVSMILKWICRMLGRGRAGVRRMCEVVGRNVKDGDGGGRW